MTTSTLAAATAMLVFALAMVYAGLTDLTSNKIRNSVIVLLVLAYAALAPLAGFAMYEIGWSAAVALGVLFAAFVMFALGVIGGGDAKLAAGAALWVGAHHTLAHLTCPSLLGGMLALTCLYTRLLPLAAPTR